MPLGSSARRRLVGAGVTLALLVTACQGVQVTNLPTDAPAAVSPVAGVATAVPVPYDLAVSAIDVEKPASKSLSEPVVLLAVIENKGTATASRIQVEGRLYAAEGKELLLKKSESIERLAAGESKVVRFKATGPLPLRDGYIVRVEAIPLAGELNLSNNSQVLRAQVQFSAAR